MTISSVEDIVCVTDVTSGLSDEILITSLIIDRGLYAVLPSALFANENGNVILSDLGDQYVEELESNMLISAYTEEELQLLPSGNIVADNNFEGTVKGHEEPEDTEILLSRKRKRTTTVESSSDGDDRDNEYADGEWIVSSFKVNNKTNFYLGQILFVCGEETDDQQPDEFLFQFYRSQIQKEQVYIKLPQDEYAKKEAIVERIEKPDIISGDKVNLIIPRTHKLVIFVLRRPKIFYLS